MRMGGAYFGLFNKMLTKKPVRAYSYVYGRDGYDSVVRGARGWQLWLLKVMARHWLCACRFGRIIG